MKKLLTILLLGAAQAPIFSQILKVQYSFETLADALFFRYDPRQNIPMSNYVGSIQDWTLLVSDELINTDEIYDRLEPKFVMIQPRFAGNLHLSANYMQFTLGISTGRYEFRNFSWHGEALFRYPFKGSLEGCSVEMGYSMINDRSFGPEAAIRAARNTPDGIKEKMKHFMTESLFEKPTSKGLKMGVYYNIFSTVDLGLSGFIDFVKRSDNAHNDFASLSLRVRLEQPELPSIPKF